MKKLLLIASLVVGVTLAFWGTSYACGLRAFLCPTKTMLPTISPGDRLGAWVSSWHASHVKRFVIAVIRSPQGAPGVSRSEIWARRIIGLPGEHVQITRDAVYVNAAKLELPTVLQGRVFTLPDRRISQQLDVRLGPDEYYVLGDNPSVSLDSRIFGPLKRQYVLGHVFTILRGKG